MPMVNCVGAFFKLHLYSATAPPKPPITLCSSTVTINYDMYPTGIADMWGTTVLTNDGGTWEGEWVGSIHSDGTHTTFETLTGSGDYAGLSLSYFTVFGDPSGEFPEQQPGLAGWIEPTDQA